MVIVIWAVNSFCGPVMSIVCFWWMRLDVGKTFVRGRLSWVEKFSDVNISRYDKGSASSSGRCEGMCLAGCLEGG